MDNLSDTLSVSCNLCTSKVKILLNMNNPQVTKALDSSVGTSEAIRLLSSFWSAPSTKIKGYRSYIRVNHPENPGGGSQK